MSRKLSVIYCDDVRQEVGNKQSYIGVYAGRLIVHKVATTLPKLCLAVTVDTPIDEPFTALTIKVYQDDQILLESPIDLKPQPAAIEECKSYDSEEPRIGMKTIFVFSPFVVEKTCWLKVRAETESGIIRGNCLHIVANPKIKTS